MWPCNDRVPESQSAWFSPKSESFICQRGSLEPLPSRVLDFNQQGAYVADSDVPNKICKEHTSLIFLAQLKKKVLAYATNRKLKKTQDITDKIVLKKL